jgi:hypothetical protein
MKHNNFKTNQKLITQVTMRIFIYLFIYLFIIIIIFIDKIKIE